MLSVSRQTRKMPRFIFVAFVALVFVASASAARSERDQKRLLGCLLESCPIEYAGFRQVELNEKEQCYVQCNPSDVDTNDRSISLAERRLIRNCVNGCFRIGIQHFVQFDEFTKLRTCAAEKCPRKDRFPPNKGSNDGPDLDDEPEEEEEQPWNPDHETPRRPREEHLRRPRAPSPDAGEHPHPRGPREEHPRRPAPDSDGDLNDTPGHSRRRRPDRPRSPREEPPRERRGRMEEAPHPGNPFPERRGPMEEAPHPGNPFPERRGPRDDRPNQHGPG